MSTIQSIPTANDPITSRAVRGWPAWLREPLLQFMFLGGGLFAVDHFLLAKTVDPHTIVITKEVDDEVENVFQAARGRDPNQQELTALQRLWLDNEVLYREGLAMQLDKGDPAIRERVIFKSLSIIDSGLKLPPHDDNTLREWFENHRTKYDEPARYDFQEAVLAGDTSEASLRAFVSKLNTGTPGNTNAGLRVFKGRPRGNLEQSYGQEFVKALDDAKPAEWHALPTRDGWRAIRLDAVSVPKRANFEALKGVVLQDWTDATMAELRTAAVRALANKYKIKFEVVKP